MNETYANLGLPSVTLRLQGGGNPEALDFQRRLRQIEAGAEEFNLDSAYVHLAAEIAAFEHDLDVEQRLALILVTVASLVALQEGSTRLPVTGAKSGAPMRRILTSLCGDAFGAGGADAMARKIDGLLASGMAATVIARSAGEYKPLLYLAPFIYHQRIRAAEQKLARIIGPRYAAAVPKEVEKKIAGALADVAARPGFLNGREVTLSDEQRAAVANAAGRGFALISGGPGTGKTSIVLAILRVLVRLEVGPTRIALAAPTGKAAFRMGESIRQGLSQVRNRADADEALDAARLEPSTVHRLLGYSPSRAAFVHHRNNPLSAAVIVVDESSMLDLALMERLASAVRPDAQLIMLGDADQLPSVAAGAIFRDLVAAAEAASDRRVARVCTRLSHNYRTDASDMSGRSILLLARRINEGAMDDADCKPIFEQRAHPDDLGFERVELVSGGGAGIEKFLDRWYAIRVRDERIDALKAAIYREGDDGFDSAATADLRRVFDHAAASRILCVTRVFPTGADRLNAAIHRRAAGSMESSADRSGFKPGEPVIMTRNDYERMLFNGDQGTIVNVDKPDRPESLMAVFARGNKFVAFHLATLREYLEFAYATTIHKAQGSEFDAVAIMMPDKDIPMLTRELLYTAVSRARKAVIIVGDAELARVAAARKEARYSGLSDLLASAKNDP
ncbi:MAG: exodeoxyribonuclease V subunit alpha [Candidatus Binataceae bacterium]